MSASAAAAARGPPDVDLRYDSNEAVKNVGIVDMQQHGRKPSERATRSRQNSLRKTKNSTDLLRERSQQRQKLGKGMASEVSPGIREGKGGQFTVANVGTNGMIFLR